MIRISTKERKDGVLDIRFLELATTRLIHKGAEIDGIGEPPEGIRHKGRTYVLFRDVRAGDITDGMYLSAKIIGPLYFVDTSYHRS